MVSRNIQPKYNQTCKQSATKGLTKARTVRRMQRPDRPSPFLVQWGSGRNRQTESFTTRTDRDKRYRQILRAIRDREHEKMLSKQEAEEWLAFKQATQGTPWVEVVAGWREFLRMTGKTAVVPVVSQAAKAFVEKCQARVTAGDMSKDHFRHKKTKVLAFAEKFGSRRMDQVTAVEVENWLSNMGVTVAATFNSWRRILHSFYRDAKVPRNPIAEVKMRSDVSEHVGILTPAETQQLFDYALAHYPEAIGRLALEAFAGLRFSGAQRLEKKDINFEDRGILLPRHKTKTKRRYYIDKLPDNLWAWLEVTNDACWSLTNSEWMHLKSRLFREAGVPHPHNCLRHSFCTYHVAAYRDPGRTATLLCHRNQQKLWDHYYGIAGHQAGIDYFAVTPQSPPPKPEECLQKQALQSSAESPLDHQPPLPTTDQAGSPGS
jgi:integrase